MFIFQIPSIGIYGEFIENVKIHQHHNVKFTHSNSIHAMILFSILSYLSIGVCTYVCGLQAVWYTLSNNSGIMINHGYISTFSEMLINFYVMLHTWSIHVCVFTCVPVCARACCLYPCVQQWF